MELSSFASYYKNRVWRTEVAHKKRERTRQQAKEKREFQKFMLIKVPPPPSLPSLTFVIVFQSLAGPGYFMPAEPEKATEKELKTPSDSKRHELVVFNPGEMESRRSAGGQDL